MADVRPVAPPPTLDRATLRELRWLVEEFNCEYAAVLDRCEIERWPEFFTEDGVYRLIARDNADAGLPLSLMSCEGMGMLKDRAYAIAHTEMFAPRYIKHLISNIRVTAYDAPHITAEANYLVLETLIDEPTRILQAGCYRDVFLERGDTLLIKERRCIYDTVLVPTCVVYPA
jgi:3-phenylpropionate/cinnamic acid dioxygenase small subunit